MPQRYFNVLEPTGYLMHEQV